MLTKDDIQRKALTVLLQHERGTAAISMGVGKTYLGLKYINTLEYINKKPYKTLIVIPKLAIVKVWREEASNRGLQHLMDNVTFTTYRSLIKQKLDYDLIILDECHNLLETHVPYLDAIPKTCKILGLTGTPPRYKTSTKGVLVNKYCPIHYTYITKDAVEEKLLNDYEIVVHYLLLDKKNNLPVNTKTISFMTSELNNYLYWTTRIDNAQSGKSKQIARVMRMKAMMEYKSKEMLAKKIMNEQTDKTIVFCNTKEQADRICKNSYHSGNLNSETNLENFKNGKISELSCVLQLNEGVNIPQLKQGIIMHSYGNERKTSQRLGRLLRLNPNDTATIHILCYKGTVDEDWVNEALKDYDPSKIYYSDHSINLY